MTTTQLQLGKTLEVTGIKIIPVEKITIQSNSDVGGGWWYGGKELYALVVSTAVGAKAVDRNGEGIDLNELINKIPSLKGNIESLVR